MKAVLIYIRGLLKLTIAELLLAGLQAIARRKELCKTIIDLTASLAAAGIVAFVPIMILFAFGCVGNFILMYVGLIFYMLCIPEIHIKKPVYIHCRIPIDLAHLPSVLALYIVNCLANTALLIGLADKVRENHFSFLVSWAVLSTTEMAIVTIGRHLAVVSSRYLTIALHAICVILIITAQAYIIIALRHNPNLCIAISTTTALAVYAFIILLMKLPGYIRRQLIIQGHSTHPQLTNQESEHD